MARRVAKGSLLWALLAVAMSALVYTPILDNYFWADDFYSLYRIRNGPLSEYLLQPLGDHLLVSVFAIFYLSYLAFGTDPQGYFATVLAVHLLNVLLFFLLLRRATGSDRLACFGALLWGTSPRLQETLGWYSVFGHALAATAILTLLHQLAGLERATTLGWRRRIAWVMLVLFAATSFGTGIGISMALPVVALLIVRRSRPRRQAVVTLAAAAAAVPVLYVLLNRMFNPRYTPVSLTNRFSLLFSDAFAQMIGNLTEYGISTALSGAFWPTPQLGTTAATVALVVFVFSALMPLVGGPARSRRYTVAALLLTFCCYATVAAGRAAFFQLTPTIGHSDRYQYIAALTIILALCVGLREVGQHLAAILRAQTVCAVPSSRALTVVASGLVAAWAVALASYHERWGQRIEHHDKARRETAQVIGQIRSAAERTPPGTDVYILNRAFQAMGPIFVRSPVFPGSAAVFVIFFPDNAIDGRRVYFVEPDHRYYQHARRGRRSAKLLVPRLPGQPRSPAK
jgi:hypothetical protein